MKRAARELKDSLSHMFPKSLDAALAKHMSAWEDIVGDLSYAAETGQVALDRYHRAGLSIELCHGVLMYFGKGSLVPIKPSPDRVILSLDALVDCPDPNVEVVIVDG